MADGSDRPLEVRILDRGEQFDGNRYIVSAELLHESTKRPVGKGCGGNGGQTIEEAIAVVHWNELDN